MAAKGAVASQSVYQGSFPARLGEVCATPGTPPFAAGPIPDSYAVIRDVGPLAMF